MEEKYTVSIGGQLFVPRYSGEDYRSRKRMSVTKDIEGNIKAVYLEGIQKIHTPIGNVNAEYVTFYPSGAIKRVFPSFGQISGFWSEDEEMKLVEEMTVSVHYQSYTAKYSCIHFYESGAVQSLTLCPEEKIIAKTSLGEVTVRNGISFYENGKIQSLEPAYYTSVNIGDSICIAFDNMANGISGDRNSLVFEKDGTVKKLTTPVSSVNYVDQNGHQGVIQPTLKRNPLNIDSFLPYPIKLNFLEGKLSVEDANGVTKVLDCKEYKIRVTQILDYMSYIECGNCKNCTGCKSTV